MKQKSIKINAILNVIKTGLSVLFPLITFPYASRVLGTDNLGKVSYSASIITYFSLLAGLGVAIYAARQGAKIREDAEKFNKFASELVTFNLLTTGVSYVLLTIVLLTVSPLFQYRNLIVLQSVSILFTTIGVEWINTVYEDYAYITIRSIAVQVLMMISLFIFVKDSSDYYQYALITVLSNCLICILNLFHCRKKVKFRLVLTKKIFEHFKPAFIFFSSQVAVNIYVSSDTTMIGWINGSYNVGLYAAAVKVYHITKQLLGALYVVTIPRLSSMSHDLNAFKKLLTDVASLLILLLLPASVGIIMLSKNIILLISGSEYVEANISLSLLGIALIFAIPSGILVNCINTPLGKEQISLKATTFSAIINITLNLLLIPFFKQNGAAITTIISELFVTFYCLKSIDDIKMYLDIHEFVQQSKMSFLGSGFVVLICFLVKSIYSNNNMVLVLSILMSLFVYGMLLFITKNKYIRKLFRIFKS